MSAVKKPKAARAKAPGASVPPPAAAFTLPQRPSFPILPPGFIWPEDALAQIGAKHGGDAITRALDWLAAGELSGYLYLHDGPNPWPLPIPKTIWLTKEGRKAIDWGTELEAIKRAHTGWPLQFDRLALDQTLLTQASAQERDAMKRRALLMAMKARLGATALAKPPTPSAFAWWPVPHPGCITLAGLIVLERSQVATKLVTRDTVHDWAAIKRTWQARVVPRGPFKNPTAEANALRVELGETTAPSRESICKKLKEWVRA